MGDKGSDIVPREVSVLAEKPLAPIVDPEAAKQAMETYQKLCAAILIPWAEMKVAKGVITQESDYQRIKVKLRDPETGRDEYVFKDFPKKSAWRKLGKFYNVSTEILDKERVDREDGSFVWHYTVKATAPNGQFTSGEGSCDSREIAKERRREHDAKATAHTRAKNRAISDLIGFGQVSAEEVIPPVKHVDAEVTVVEPEKKTQLRLGRVNANVIAYNLMAIGVGEEDVSVSEQEDGFYITPSKKLDDDTYYPIKHTLEPMGAEWQDDRKLWIIWKEAKK